MPDISTIPYFSTNTGETFIQVDAAAVVDSVFVFLRSDGNKYQLLLKGPYPARVVCRGGGDKTTELQAVFNHADVQEVVFDNGIVTVNGALNCGNKRITIKDGARLEGTGTISSATSLYNWSDDAIASSLTLTSVTTVGGMPVYTTDAEADARGQRLYYNGSSNKFRAKLNITWTTVPSPETSLPIVIDGGGVAIATGVLMDVVVPFDCTVTGWTITAKETGSIVVDLWQDTYANFPATVADTITGANKPTLSSAIKNQNLALSWTLTKGSIIRVNVDSAATVTNVTLNLHVIKT